MFPFFRWNAQAQIPPKGSFIQKYRFAFGEWLTFKGSLHVVCCWDVWPDFMRVSPRHCWPLLGTAEFCTAFVGALGKRHTCQWCCSSLLSNQSLASPWDCEGWCLLVPSGCTEQSCAIILSSAAGLAFCKAHSQPFCASSSKTKCNLQWPWIQEFIAAQECIFCCCLQIVVGLCLQVLSRQHFAAAGFLSRIWFALSDISIPA